MTFKKPSSYGAPALEKILSLRDSISMKLLRPSSALPACEPGTVLHLQSVIRAAEDKTDTTPGKEPEARLDLLSLIADLVQASELHLQPLIEDSGTTTEDKHQPVVLLADEHEPTAVTVMQPEDKPTATVQPADQTNAAVQPTVMQHVIAAEKLGVSSKVSSTKRKTATKSERACWGAEELKALQAELGPLSDLTSVLLSGRVREIQSKYPILKKMSLTQIVNKLYKIKK